MCRAGGSRGHERRRQGRGASRSRYRAARPLTALKPALGNGHTHEGRATGDSNESGGARGRWERRYLFRRGFDCSGETEGSTIDFFSAQAVHFQGMSGRDRLKVLVPLSVRCH